MSNEIAWWLLLSFGIMVVAMLATLHEKLERVEERLNSLEEQTGGDRMPARPGTGLGAEPLRHRDRRA